MCDCCILFGNGCVWTNQFHRSYRSPYGQTACWTGFPADITGIGIDRCYIMPVGKQCFAKCVSALCRQYRHYSGFIRWHSFHPFDSEILCFSPKQERYMMMSRTLDGRLSIRFFNGKELILRNLVTGLFLIISIFILFLISLNPWHD